MAEHALQVETVDTVQTTRAAGECRSQTHSTVIYLWQIALLAARASTLEHELARERRKHQRVIERYEHLLDERDAEIERLETERDVARGGIGAFLSRR